MQVSTAIFLGWVVLVVIWLLNHFFYENQRYEEEYRRKRYPPKS